MDKLKNEGFECVQSKSQAIISPIHKSDALRRKLDETENQQNFQEIRHFNYLRFVVCSLGLLGFVAAIMSRSLFNVVIVDIAKSGKADQKQLAAVVLTPDASHEELTGEEETNISTTIVVSKPNFVGRTSGWSVSQQNTLLASYYIGYSLSMSFFCLFAHNLGPKYPLLVGGLGSGLVNMATPHLVQYWSTASSVKLLASSRIALGVLQGAMLPSLYGLFNKWLGETETSIFASLIKVALAFGAALGTSLAGLMYWLGFRWPAMLQVASFVCLFWLIVWLPVASSEPQKSKLISQQELERVLKRRRGPPLYRSTAASGRQTGSGKPEAEAKSGVSLVVMPERPEVRQTKIAASRLWLLILTHPSVLALALVKFTYNIAMDFITIELAVYLRNVHNLQLNQIGAISTSCLVIHMTLTTLVGWSTGRMVKRSTFGWTKTRWRKVLQGTANFSIALVFLILSMAQRNLPLAVGCLLGISTLWMLGAGGELMVPYDLSTKYPATIAGLTHSISMLPGLLLPLTASYIIADDSTNPDRWSVLFQLISCVLTFGGLVFVCVHKSEPFLPGEVEPEVDNSN